MQRTINFSGGKSSAYMTILVYKPGDIVLFCDTGREHPKTYKFINDFEAFTSIPVIRIAYDGGFESMIRKEGYNTVPNRVMRYCTKHLKILAARKYLQSVGITEIENCIGFRSDEHERIIKSKPRWVKYHQRFPLNELGIDNQKVNAFWKGQAFTLEIPRILGNCDLCFLKGKNAIISILKVHPELAKRWIDDEVSVGGTYIKGISYQTMLDIANNNLFKKDDLNQVSAAYNCACTT